MPPELGLFVSSNSKGVVPRRADSNSEVVLGVWVDGVVTGGSPCWWLPAGSGDTEWEAFKVGM